MCNFIFGVLLAVSTLSAVGGINVANAASANLAPVLAHQLNPLVENACWVHAHYNRPYVYLRM